MFIVMKNYCFSFCQGLKTTKLLFMTYLLKTCSAVSKFP